MEAAKPARPRLRIPNDPMYQMRGTARSPASMPRKPRAQSVIFAGAICGGSTSADWMRADLI